MNAVWDASVTPDARLRRGLLAKAGFLTENRRCGGAVEVNVEGALLIMKRT